MVPSVPVTSAVASARRRTKVARKTRETRRRKGGKREERERRKGKRTEWLPPPEKSLGNQNKIIYVSFFEFNIMLSNFIHLKSDERMFVVHF